MGEVRKPRLLVLGGGPVDADHLAASLYSDFDLVVTDADHAMQALQETPCEAILLPAGEFLPLERQLLSRESTVLLNAIGEGLSLQEADGVVLWSNDRFARYDQTLRRRLSELARHASDHFAGIIARYEKEREQAEAKPRPIRMRPKRYSLSLNRRGRYYEVLATPVLAQSRSNSGPATTTIRIALAVRDVTARERTRAKIEAINAAGQELVHIESETVASLHAADRLKLLEQRVVRYADELLHFDHFAIRMHNPRTNKLQLVIARDLAPDAMDIEFEPGTEEQGISGWVAETGRSYICQDASDDPLYVFGIDNAGSSLTVPLRLFDKVIGIFNIESHDVRAFTDQDRQFAEIFAGYIAMALHILNLLIVERRATRERATGTVRGELSAPLNDLVHEAEALRQAAGDDPALRSTIERILGDVEAIQKRVRMVDRGPQTVLGLDETIGQEKTDEVLGNKRVLVVDDEEHMRETISDVLVSRGAEVVSCEGAKAALKLLDSSDECCFDLVISDIDTGDGTGYEVFSAVRKRNAALPVILMTGFGYDPHHSIVRASQEGLQAVLFKPFRAERLLLDAKKAIRPDMDFEMEDTRQ